MQTPADSVYRFGQFEVNAASGELSKNGKRLKLQDQPFRLLLALLESAGDVVTREELRARIWPEDMFVDFEGSLRVAVRKLRDALGDDADSPHFIETIPKRGYRFLYATVRSAESVSVPGIETAAVVKATASSPSQSRPARWILSTLAALVVIAAPTWLLLHRERHEFLSERDTVVLADFRNTTGDPVFEETLRQGLAVQLEQSPFLNLISDERIRQTLQLMDQPAGARLTPEVAYDLCQRTQSAVVISGTIGNLGNLYIVGLKAINCRNGDSLSQEQATASSKEQVLSALGAAAAKLRQRLGESLNSVQKFDMPLPEATTSSLEALQAYALGRKTGDTGAFAATIPFFQRAIHLDPNFALAYGALGSVYSYLDEMTLSQQYVRKAYDLRARITEHEKLNIESAYYHIVTGDLEKARQAYELEAQIYPRDPAGPLQLWLLYSQTGQLDQALDEVRESLRRNPLKIANHGQLVAALTYLNQLDEARTEANRDLADGFDSFPLRIQLYRLDFLNNDEAGMETQVKWALGKPGIEDEFLEQEADTAAYFAQVNKARGFSGEAAAAAIQAQKIEKSAVFEGRAALREALLGNVNEVHSHSAAALGPSTPREAKYAGILALAMVGDTARAQVMANEFAKQFPDDTLVRFEYMPTIDAQIALNRGQAAKSIEALRAAGPYELAAITVPLYLAPVYVRGEAYLASHDGAAAAREFQKIIDHRGIVRNHLVGALAYLQLGRAYAMIGDKTQAKAAYEDFFSLWKKPDSNIPVLTEAKSEYVKLQ